MIQVVIDTLIVGVPPSPSAILLRPMREHEGKGRVLPIWIGSAESMCIGMALQNMGPGRPMTHDLLGSFLEVSGAEMQYVVINNVVGTTFYATIVFGQGGETKNVDARPSDAIALAIRNKVPVYVEEQVLDVADFPSSFNPAITNQIESEAFHEFIQKLNPDDFRRK